MKQNILNTTMSEVHLLTLTDICHLHAHYQKRISLDSTVCTNNSIKTEEFVNVYRDVTVTDFSLYFIWRLLRYIEGVVLLWWHTLASLLGVGCMCGVCLCPQSSGLRARMASISTSLPLVSPRSNHSTVTDLVSIFTPETIAEWIRPGIC